jgi:hypothetical protein
LCIAASRQRSEDKQPSIAIKPEVILLPSATVGRLLVAFWVYAIGGGALMPFYVL